MKAAILILALILAAGCAGSRIRPVEEEGRGDPARLASALAEYNREGSALRVLGEARGNTGPRIGFGARALVGSAVRMDGLAFPSTRVLFSAACGPEVGCEVYLPDEVKVYRDPDGWMGGWLSMLVTGRIPLVGAPTHAAVDKGGFPVLVSVDGHGQWSRVVFDREGKAPVRAVYGDSQGRPKLEIVLSGFPGGAVMAGPGEIMVGGESEGEEFVLRIERIEDAGEIPEQAFRLRIPEGVRSVEASGSAAWKKLGMFWIPKK